MWPPSLHSTGRWLSPNNALSQSLTLMTRYWELRGIMRQEGGGLGRGVSPVVNGLIVEA